jgi:penicillin-binding protein 2
MRDDVEFRGFKYYLLKFLRSRSLYVVLLVAGLTGVLLWKLYDMQIVRGDEYKKKATETVLTTAELTVKARRGNIYDSNGVLLATTRTAYKVNMVNTPDDQSTRDRMYLRLIELFEADNDTYSNMLRRYITPELEWGSALAGDEKAAARSNWINTLVSGRRKSDRDNILTARDAFNYLRNTVFELDESYTEEQAYKIMIIRYATFAYGLSSLVPMELASDAGSATMEYLTAHSYEFPGISTEEVYFRVYVDDASASHIVGYVHAISQSEYEELKDKGYSRDDMIGKTGVEKAAEEYLKGVNGTRVVYRDTDGTIKTLSYTPPVPGGDVYLTIDYSLQSKTVQILEQSIADIVAARDDVKNFGDACAASAVVENVKTGEILALANFPYYDNNIFAAPSTDADAQQAIIDLFQDPTSPALNRATQGLYPVGSTIKPLISIAGLESGTITEKTVVNCQRRMEIAGRTHSCLSRHGEVSLIRALAKSCNIYFYTVGIGTGIDTIDYWAKAFGLGEKTGIEIAEYAGYRSNPTTMKLRERDRYHIWSDSDTAQSSIGQLYTLFTPLQLCNYASALSNGGWLNTPHVLAKVLNSDGEVVYTDEAANADRVHTGVSTRTLKLVKEGMTEMVKQNATAAAAFKSFPEGFVCAKTGTPETGMEAFGESSHSVFICYAPADDPVIAVSILIEHGASGSNSSPAAGKIFDAYFHTDTELGQKAFSGYRFGWQSLVFAPYEEKVKPTE